MNDAFRWIACLACSAVGLLGGCGRSAFAPVDRMASLDTDSDDGGGGAGGGTVTAGIGVTGCGAALSARLQKALNAAVKAQHLPGAAAAVNLAGCKWRGASGSANKQAMVPMQPDDLFRVGSITKTFISTLALMLRGEGKLALDSAVSGYVKGVPDGDRITVRQLLNHTSGLFDFTESEEFWQTSESDPGHAWTPAQLIGIAAAKPPYFEPGHGFHYSNTNYIVAGLLVEAVSGEHIGDLLRDRILEPAHLAHTYLDGSQPVLPGLIHGYGQQSGGLADTTWAFDPSLAWTAGALVSTTDDLTSFYAQLLGGALLGPNELKEMTTWVTTPPGQTGAYGLGLRRRASALGTSYGHDGSIWGFVSASYYVTERNAAVTVLGNLESGDMERIVDDLSDVLKMP
jgi:D-alanyl-D-alanine carboxypeptidase